MRYNTVQEQSTTNWSASSAGPSVKKLASSPVVRMRFTGWSLPAGVSDHFNDTTASTSLAGFTDCQFAGGKFTAYPGSLALTNCLWQRVYLTLRDDAEDMQWHLFNNLFYGGTLYYKAVASNPTLLAYDNLLDQTVITRLSGSEYFTHDYNGYLTNQNRLDPNGAHDVILTNVAYQIGPLGNFYLPAGSALINAGSRNATNAGLYFFTTTTNEVRENNTDVDIGFHSAADLDGDGVPDYADTDDDGDGLPDDWEIQSGLNPELNDAADDPDGDWITNLQEYNGGTNSTNPRDVMVVAWGNNADGQCNVPEGLRNAIAVAGGLEFSLARTNGSVLAWGANTYGQTNVPAGLTNVARVSSAWRQTAVAKSNGTVVAWGLTSGSVPADLTNAVSVAAGPAHVLALRTNGQVTAWGNNDFGKCDVPASVTNVVAIAAGSEHSIALLANGTMAAWGLNAASWGWNLTNVPAGLSNFVAVAAGDFHNVALKWDGTVVAWGAGNGTNLSGNFLNSEQGQSIVPAGLSNVIAIAAGGHRSLALRADGTIVGWGDNFFSQGTAPPGVSNLTAIAAGPNHSLAIRDGRQLPIFLQHPSDQAAPAGSNVTFTARGLGLAEVHYQWQFNGTNIVGATNATLTLNNVQASNEGSYQVIISTGAGSLTSSAATFTLITPPVLVFQTQPDRQWVTTSPFLQLRVEVTGPFLNYQWKLNGTNIQYSTASAYTVPFFKSSEERQYSVTITNAAGTTNSTTWKVHAFPSGGIAAWGNNDYGQLDWPSSASNVIAIAAGGSHSLAAREDGSVVAWGLNDAGQTNGPTLTSAIAVAAGHKHSLALKENGTVIAWGRNVEGQTNVPSGLTNVMAIAAGGNQNLALRKNGTVTNWGNTFGTIPSNLTNAIAIAAGTNFCLALRSNGTIAAWGNNANGQTNVPANATNVVAIAAGDFHALALKENGTIVAWGANGSGQTSVPSGLSNVMAIAAGWAHSAALKNDGTVVAWGDNSETQADVGSGLKGIKLLATGGEHTLASAFWSYVQYQVDVSKDLLLIYNTNSLDSSNVWYYYMQHRPMVGGANVLPIGCPTGEFMGTNEFITQLETPLRNWLNANPTLHPTYMILFLDIPSRMTNTQYPEVYGSVSFALRERMNGIKPFVTHINMDGTNDCIAYINKLAAFGTNGHLLISASTGGYNNTNFVFDNVRHGPNSGDVDYTGFSYVISNAIPAVKEAFPGAGIIYADGIESTNLSLPHITNAVNVAGYMSWGFHSSLNIHYAANVRWTGDSGWWLIETIESPNGQRSIYGGLGLFLKWFSATAFGGTNYSNTPVGGVTHTQEPGLDFVNDAATYFGLWARGKSFAIAAWNSRRTEFFQAVGDPFVER